MKQLLFIVAVLLGSDAVAQAVLTPDLPLGSPYNVGAARVGAPYVDMTAVPLRDYLSSRIDQAREELLRLLDERERQYMQRFEAQEKALGLALQVSREQAMANQTAIVAASDATALRFNSVNEFRQTLTDQAQTFASKTTVDAKFLALDDKITLAIGRLDSLKSASEGASNVWGYIVGIGGLLVGGLALFFSIIPARTRRT